MRQHQLDALRTVLDLAYENALDPENEDTILNDLVEEAERQQAALATVEELWTKEMNG